VTIDLVLVGFGNVGRRFVRLLDESRLQLRREHNLDTRVVGIATRAHGQAFDARGLDAARLAAAVDGGARVGPAAGSSVRFLRGALKQCRTAVRSGRLVVVETTTLSIRNGQPAVGHVRAALRGGAHVVTANKGPAAFAFRALKAAADRADRWFLFESAVMDGVPIFNLRRATLPALTITGFEGVVNSTTNHILTAMENGQPFDDALAAMQLAGIAEADASLDVDGWDAAAKAAALANAMLGANITPHSVDREGIRSVTAERLAAARTSGRRLKLVASGARTGKAVRASVRVVERPRSDLLSQLEGQENALVLHTDRLGDIAIVQRGSGLTLTAYGLLSDLVTIARDWKPTRAIRQPRPPARRGRTRSARGRR
jgi:homoserine dehydrogenase